MMDANLNAGVTVFYPKDMAIVLPTALKIIQLYDYKNFITTLLRAAIKNLHNT